MRQYHWYQLFMKSCLAAVLLLTGFHGANAQEVCITQSTGDQVRETTSNGYTHELWSQFTDSGQVQGTACMTPEPGTTFNARWDGTFNYLARRGLAFDGSELTHQDRGHFNISYASNFNCSNIDGLSYLSVYGWTRDFDKEEANPEGSPAHQEALVEYYIIENWCDWNVSQDPNAEDLGTLNVDGATYHMYRTERIAQPAIRCEERYMNAARDNCDSDFYQYWSIREDSQLRSSGEIDVSAHFSRWEDLTGIEMGGLHEVMMKVEGYNESNQSSGNVNFTELEVTDSMVTFSLDHYNINTWCTYPGFPPVASFNTHIGGSFPDIAVTSSNPGVLEVTGQLTYQFLLGMQPGNATITLYSPSGEEWDTAQVTVNGNSNGDDNCTPPQFLNYVLAAEGSQGGEELNVTLDGEVVNSHTLSTNYEVYTGTILGEGEVGVEFINDDGLENGRDVRLDYIEVNGERRETEAMTQNSAAYDNGVCGGGSYTEWLHCDGSVNYGEFDNTHTITIRARGNAGGEHINLLIDGQPVNDGWWLGTSYQEYTATVSGDGDINVSYDNDGGQKDVVIDWVKVNNQTPRQAENMDYNTGAWANGSCGGGTRTQWLHCNGVIGFGNISDNFD